MFGKAFAVSLFLASTSAALAAEDLSLEPCINGGVSSTGNFPTQEMEDQSQANRDWRSEDDMFRVAAERRRAPAEAK